MKKRLLSVMLSAVMALGLVPIIAGAAETISVSPYPKIEYSYTSGVSAGTIRYIAQNNESAYFDSRYWPSHAFGGYVRSKDECGTACISMALSYVGVDRTPKVLLESTNGYTGQMWGRQGDATSSSVSISQSEISTAMNNYINGNGKYSPLCIYIQPWSSTSSMHWVLLIGRISENTYLALNPWHTAGTNATLTMQINGSRATYNGTTNPITSVNQWYNPNAPIPPNDNTKSDFTCSITSPSGTIEAKKACVVRGTATSARPITKINAWVENSSGKTVISASCNPGGTSFSFAGSAIDKGLVFQNITENGQYHLKVTISDDKTTSQTYSFPFNVTGGNNASVDYSITLSGETKPTSLDVGNVFILKGTISSPATLTSVTVGVFDQESGGTMKTGRTVSPNSTSYNIANIDAYVEFNKLPAGTYYYRITATNAGGTKTLLNHKFTVGSQQPVVAKPSNVKVTTDKSTYTLGETVTITPSATGATQYSYRVCYETYGDDTTEVFQYGFTGNRTFVPDKEGTYIVRISAINDGGYTDGECSFVVVKPKPNTYTVTYDANGGIGAPSAQTKEAGTALTLSNKVPERNYILTYDFNKDQDSGSMPIPMASATFTGWNTKQDGTGTFYSTGSSYTSDASVTLYAQWAPGKIEKLYTLTFTNGDKVFDGWYTAPQGGTKVSEGTTITDNMTIYAHWRAATDPVAVDQDGVHFERQTVYFQGQFKDVPAEQWFTKSVASAFELGLMKGNSATTFNPYGDVTLAEAITMASRIHSIYTTGTENFIQGEGKWYQVYLDYALENGIITKAYCNSDVNHKATRAQFAEIFAKSLPDKALYPMNTIGDNAIPDVSSTESYAPYVYKLYRAGILTGGDAKGTFSPGTYITRAEAAAIVSRMAESNNRVAFSLK